VKSTVYWQTANGVLRKFPSEIHEPDQQLSEWFIEFDQARWDKNLKPIPMPENLIS